MKPFNIIRLLALGACVVAAIVQAQESRTGFEAATIRLDPTPDRSSGRNAQVPKALKRTPERIAYSHVSLAELVMRAYELPDYRMEWPDKFASARSGYYSINATFPAKTTDSELRAMLRALLVDRLALHAHWVDKTLSAYELKAAPGGPKLLQSKFNPAGSPGDSVDEARAEKNRYSVYYGNNDTARINGVVTLEQLVRLFGRELGEPMLDQTNLRGYYDIDFSWPRPNPASRAIAGQTPTFESAFISEKEKAAALLPALDKQLGLKAEPAKLPVKVLVIDSVNPMPRLE